MPSGRFVAATAQRLIGQDPVAKGPVLLLLLKVLAQLVHLDPRRNHCLAQFLGRDVERRRPVPYLVVLVQIDALLAVLPAYLCLVVCHVALLTIQLCQHWPSASCLRHALTLVRGPQRARQVLPSLPIRCCAWRMLGGQEATDHPLLARTLPF